jgi:hypothetical protein
MDVEGFGRDMRCQGGAVIRQIGKSERHDIPTYFYGYRQNSADDLTLLFHIKITIKSDI